MSKPSILVDGHVLDGKPQGSSAYLAGLYGEIARQGAARLYVASRYQSSLDRWFPGVPGLEWVPLTSTNKFQRLGVEMAHLQSKIAPNYAHFQYITPLMKHCKWINTIHDLLFLDYIEHFPLKYRLMNGTLFRISALRSDILLTVSEYSRDAIHRHFGIDRARIHVTPNALDRFVDAPDSPVSGLSPHQFITYVSRFEPRKNQHSLVQAIADMGDDLPEGFRLVLVGYPAIDYPELDTALAKAGDRVIILSNLSHEQITWLYRHAAASLYPSHAEGFGIPVIEAVAAGGISYCADNTGMSELAPYLHGSFNADDPAQIRRMITRAIDGADRAGSANIRAKAVNAFSWKHSATAFLKAINA